LTLARFYASAGNSEESRKLLHDVIDSIEEDKLEFDEVAAVYTALGEKDRAFECLERAYDARGSWMCYLTSAPIFDGLRSDPRYSELLRRMGLPEVAPHFSNRT